VITVLLVRDAPRHGDRAGQREPEEPAAKAGYLVALADRRLRRFLAMTFVAEFVYIQSTVGLPLHVTSVGLSAADYGLLIGLNGLLVVLFELLVTGAVSRRRPGYVLALGNVFTGAGLALTVFAHSMVWLSATVLLWTAGEMLYASMAAAYLGGLPPPYLVGRYQGLYGAAITAGTGLGPLIGGLVYASSTTAFWALVGLTGLWSAQLCLPPRYRGTTRGGPVLASAEGGAHLD
jgi:predicted MFS family arabinose efflux permease